MPDTQVSLRSRLAFRISPLLDLALGVLVLQNPERFGRPAWAEAIQARLPDGVLARLEERGTDLFALALELDDRPEPPPVVLARLAERDPGLADDLLVCWQALAPEFAAAAATLAEALQRDSERLRSTDPVSFLAGLSDRISVAGDGDALILQWGRGMRVPLADLDRILLVPSAFCPRRLMFYRHGRTLVLFYAPQREEPVSAAEPPERLLLGYAALADATRLRILQLVASQRVPAQEMARRLGINESTVSRHLRVLLEAGLIARDGQEGRYVFYAFNPDRLDELAAGTRAYLYGDTHGNAPGAAPGAAPGDAHGAERERDAHAAGEAQLLGQGGDDHV